LIYDVVAAAAGCACSRGEPHLADVGEEDLHVGPSLILDGEGVPSCERRLEVLCGLRGLPHGVEGQIGCSHPLEF